MRYERPQRAFLLSLTGLCLSLTPPLYALSPQFSLAARYQASLNPSSPESIFAGDVGCRWLLGIPGQERYSLLLASRGERRVVGYKAAWALPSFGVEGTVGFGPNVALSAQVAAIDVDRWDGEGTQVEFALFARAALLGPTPVQNRLLRPQGFLLEVSAGPWARASRYRTARDGRPLERWGFRPAVLGEYRRGTVVLSLRGSADVEPTSEGLRSQTRVRERLAWEPSRELRVGAEHEHVARFPNRSTGRNDSLEPWTAVGTRIGLFAEAQW